ncbi:hypothetical protein QA942_12065 [Streptomyces sp. B21-106]|uniref:hypothetical protein n=1 Tax=Streptomyces sp. B21-106 TaxID=3039418 RepID=UPI002FF06101
MEPQPKKNPRFEADMAFVVTGGPPRYARHTGRPVRYLTVADTDDRVIGYVWANDEDEAGGVRIRSDASPAAHNEFGRWGDRLRDAKRRGIAPTQALAEMIRDSPFSPRSHVVPGSLTEAPSIIVVDDLTGRNGA